MPRTQDPILPAEKIRKLEDEFIPKSLQRDYDKPLDTIGTDRLLLPGVSLFLFSLTCAARACTITWK
mgnify:CR=1 FL=1